MNDCGSEISDNTCSHSPYLFYIQHTCDTTKNATIRISVFYTLTLLCLRIALEAPMEKMFLKIMTNREKYSEKSSKDVGTKFFVSRRR